MKKSSHWLSAKHIWLIAHVLVENAMVAEPLSLTLVHAAPPGMSKRPNHPTVITDQISMDLELSNGSSDICSVRDPKAWFRRTAKLVNIWWLGDEGGSPSQHDFPGWELCDQQCSYERAALGSCQACLWPYRAHVEHSGSFNIKPFVMGEWLTFRRGITENQCPGSLTQVISTTITLGREMTL